MLQNIEKIRDWLSNHRISKFRINSDFSVDVIEDVFIFNKNYSKIDVNFNSVIGNFSIFETRLEDLTNCPKYLSGDFTYSYQSDQSAKLKYNGFPKNIGGDITLKADFEIDFFNPLNIYIQENSFICDGSCGCFVKGKQKVTVLAATWLRLEREYKLNQFV